MLSLKSSLPESVSFQMKLIAVTCASGLEQTNSDRAEFHPENRFKSSVHEETKHSLTYDSSKIESGMVAQLHNSSIWKEEVGEF